MLARRVISSALLSLCVVSGCDRSAETPAFYAVSVEIEGDPHTPLASAVVERDGVPLATTGADGRAALQLHGAEGDIASLNIKCPAEYTSPAAPLDVPLRRLADASRVASYRVSCPPETRRMVVAVRAANGADLPVMYLGREVARTDASGAAHFELHLHAGERFELALSTDQHPALTPKDPSALFVASDHDDLLFFEQRFDVPRTRQTVRRGPRAF